MKSRVLLKLGAAGICWALASSVGAQDDAGRFKFSTCSGCHAIPGYTNVYPTYRVPKLGGQHADYIISALKAYKAGQRDHETMHANASNLNEEDMAAIAQYLSNSSADRSEPPVTGDPEAGQAKLTELQDKNPTAYCGTCHGEDGNSAAPTFPRLAGQYEDYLLKSLLDYRSEARSAENPNAGLMINIAQQLSEQELADLAAYYASQTPVLAVIEY